VEEDERENDLNIEMIDTFISPFFDDIDGDDIKSIFSPQHMPIEVKIEEFDINNDLESLDNFTSPYFENIEIIDEVKNKQAMELELELSSLNKRKQKKLIFFTNYKKLTLMEKLRTILNGGKPLVYFPTDIAKASANIINELSVFERKRLLEKIEKSKMKEWDVTREEIINQGRTNR
jgi:hypothetical protein